MRRAETALTIGGVLLAGAAAATAARRRRTMRLKGRVAVVTGGSRGLGLLIARELGRLGARVVLVARDEAELRRAQEALRSEGLDPEALAADVCLEANARRVVLDTVARFGRLDVLVNNAGVITAGPLDHMTVADFEEAMATHFWGPLHTMRAAIPHMREMGGGRIVNISSIGGRVGVPHLVPYCASKFALTGLSTAMRAELRKDGIQVTTVCPGLMRTGSPFNAWFKGRHRQEFAWFAIADSLPLLSIDGERAAARIVDAARHGDAELVISWPAKLAIAATAVMPNIVAAALALVDRVLPRPADKRGNQRRSGWQSVSAWAPSLLTRLSEGPAARNNELPAPQYRAARQSPA
ncbi:MAG TPA: SDR family oxidoreductase [Vicinamibacterales bacterium]|nr:SDR family oxidoreductase [Vicinamibacterales bacterium]